MTQAIPPDGIVDIAQAMNYSLADSHEAFERVANILRNRVRELEIAVKQYKHAINVMDECRLALYTAALEK